MNAKDLPETKRGVVPTPMSQGESVRRVPDRVVRHKQTAGRKDTPEETNGETETGQEKDIVEVYLPQPTFLTKMNRIDTSAIDDRRRRRQRRGNLRNGQ
jgi:hypothetical protein